MTKVISISDDAYDGLSRLKGEKDSFTKVIMRLVRSDEGELPKWVGLWKDRPEMDKIFDEVIAERRNAKPREFPEW